MKAIAEVIKDARARAGLSQQDVVLRARRAGLPVSLRVLSKLESGGSCRIETVQAIYRSIPPDAAGNWSDWVASALARTASRYSAEIKIGRQVGRTHNLGGALDSLPKHMRDGLEELVKDPAGVRLLNGTIKSFDMLKKSISKPN